TVFHIGIPLHNRRGKDLKDVMGLLMRVVPLRVEVLPGDTVATLITKIKRGTIKAIQHGQHLINNNHKDPVYDVLLNFHTWKGAAFHTQPLRVDWVHPMQAYESLALNVHDMERGFEGNTANIQIDFDFHQEVFAAALQQQVMEHFCHLFATCIRDLNQSVGELSLLSPREYTMIVGQWNDTAMPLPKTCIHHLIEEQAGKTPHAPAVRFEGREVTYRELNARANQLAHYLRARGVGRDVLVGICMDRSIEMVIGLLGIVKAGGAYVPVDPTYPRERIAFMLADSGVSLLLVQEKLLDQLPDHNAQTLCLDAEWSLISEQARDNLPGEVRPDDLAYMIYTSGSTGKPKGAMNTHVAILNRLLWMQKEYHIDGTDRILQKTPFSFDVSVWEFFWPLMFGATLVVARPEGHKDSAYLRDLIQAEAITTLHFVPSMLQIFLEEEGIESLTTLKRVICSGEALSTEVQKRFFNRLKAGLHNLYGPTEAAIDVTYWACQPDDHRHTVPIGRPVANTQIYILDKDLHPVPVGVPGELHIGGIQLARGYHRREDLTQEKFIPDPFGREEHARLYKTGDLACFMPDGNVEYLGRMDHQVKIRGFRIELGEIETALLRYPGVKECVVIARKDAGGNASLAAYLVVEGAQPAVQDVRNFLLINLPDYMVPALMLFLDRMPLSPNGKLDRKALPEPQDIRASLQKDYVAPRTPLEEQLAQIFADLLGIDKVGIHDNFFELGGHSLQAIRLISRIRAELHVELPLRIFFESSNIADLGIQVEQARERQSQRPLLELTPVPRDGKLPLAFTQKRLWILDQLEPGSSAYNMPTAIRIKGPFRAHLFERIFNTIIARHEVLRTTFSAENGQPYLVITPHVEIPLTLHDLLDWPREERMAEAWRLATAEAALPFDLTQGPLVRAQALRVDEDEHVLLFTTHHIVSDGWSIAVFVDEIQQLYNALSSNLPSPLPALPIQFADYAYWQNEWFKGEALQTQLEYWKNKMEGAPALLELPTDRVRPALEGHAGRNIDFEFDADLTRDLKALAQQKGATLFMVLHAVFLMLLSKYSRQEDIVLGTPTANRNFYEVEPLIGFFVNTLLLRVDLSGDPTFDELLARVKQTDIEAFDQQQVPFEHLLETLKPERSLSYSPWFQVLFVLQNTPPWDSRQIKDLEFSDFGYETTSAKFDISMDMREEGDLLTGLVQYKTDLFDDITIERMIAQFGRLLKDVAGQPALKLSQYALISDAEHSTLLKEWNQTQLDYPREKCIHQLFEEQVKRTPHAVALVHEDRQLTYDQLNRRANVLAHFLRHKGVKPNSFVGVFLERSVDMIVSLLGILKAGGAYVPLDPKYPTDRLEYMIDDTGLGLILSSQKVFDERSLLLNERVETICLDTDWDTIEQEFDDRAQQPPNGYPLNSRNLAYVIYTSGSTGQPKGVLIEHRSLVNYTCWVRKEYEITADDRVLQFASISFDAAGEEIYGTLTTGAALVLRTDEMISSGRTFFELC
ncbi:MAG: amino acid adenylation domain-containing protein, partial [Candidatus Omnitrophica bacterium]|nr:amino acid adenylation domain-containing protein [Candidatus Omnitrophota bacterium]